jgi:RHS repeat-associated protein
VDNLLSVTDPLNQVTQYGYDALNRQISQTDALNRATTFAYDAIGKLLSLTDPLNNVTSYTYDALNRLTRETNPLTLNRNYEYDGVGNLTRLTDRNGRVRTFGYDALNRRTTENWLNSSSGVIQTITATYDAAGRLTGIADPNATYAHTYDALNQLTAATTSNPNIPGFPTTSLLATYNAIGSRTSLRDQITNQVRGSANFGYDLRQQLTAVSQTGTGIASKRVNFAYDAVGQMTTLSRFITDASTPQVFTTFTYGSTGLTTQLQHRLGTTLLSDHGWTHDAGERVTRYTSTDGTSDYSYDLTDQLTLADHSYQTDEAYSYDANGNRTNTGYTTGPNNRLLSDGTFTYTYDNEGNRTQRSRAGEIVTYTWDHRNRLTRIEIKDTAGGAMTRWANYTYDAFDRRVSKTVDPDGAGPNPAIVQRFVYDRDHIWLCFNDTNNVTHRYLYGPEIDMVLVEERSATDVRWPLADNQGTIRDITNNAGAIQNHITYNSFGRFVTQTNANISTRFNYTGREVDGETGLYYYRSRYYDPVVGRFLSEDAIGFAGGDPNLYRYVGNSPVNAIDPFGYFNIHDGTTLCQNALPRTPNAGKPKPPPPKNKDCDDPKKIKNRKVELTAERLKMLGEYLGLGKSGRAGTFYQELGDRFEAVALKSLNLPKYSGIAIPTPLRGQKTQALRDKAEDRGITGKELNERYKVYSGTKPDALIGTMFLSTDFTIMGVNKLSNFFEVKAGKGSVSLSSFEYQALGLLEAASMSPAAKAGFPPRITFISTSSLKIGQTYKDEATKRGIALRQILVYESCDYPGRFQTSSDNLPINLDVYPNSLKKPKPAATPSTGRWVSFI